MLTRSRVGEYSVDVNILQTSHDIDAAKKLFLLIIDIIRASSTRYGRVKSGNI